MKKFMLVMLPIAALGYAAVALVAGPARAATEADQAAQVAELEATRDTLRADLAQIASEKARCERQRRNWRTATIIGGVGVAATATGAIVQHSRNKDAREERDELQADLKKQQDALKVEQDKLK